MSREHTMYAVYDIKSEEELIVSVGTVDEVCYEFGCSRRMVYLSAQKGSRIHNRYVAVEVGKESEFE